MQQCSRYARVLQFCSSKSLNCKPRRTRLAASSLMESAIPKTTTPVRIIYVIFISNSLKTSIALWSKNLVDSEKTLQGFFDGCYEAGPQRCSFYAPSPDAISANLTALYKRLRTAPVPVKTDSGYGVLDYRRLRRAVFLSLYSPYAKFPILADALSELARGSGNLLYNMTREPDVKCSCPDSSNELASVNEATMFVACNDGASVPNNLTEIEEYYAEISSEYDFGSLWAGLRIGCSYVNIQFLKLIVFQQFFRSGWPRLPKDHFQGLRKQRVRVLMLIAPKDHL